MNTLERQRVIRSMKKEGKSTVEIARKYNISRQRVDMILRTDYGITRNVKVICAGCGDQFINKTIHFRKFCDVCSPILLSIDGRERTREIVRIRDKHTCQKCGIKWDENMRRFDIHHLDGVCGKKSRGYDSSSDLSKLITYCHKCHMNLDEVKYKILTKTSPRSDKKSPIQGNE